MAQLGAIIGVSLLAYMAAAWAAGKLLGLSETDFYIFWGALSAIGVIAAGVFLWWKMRQQEAADLPADAPMDPNDEVDALIREAETKLAASRMGKGASIGTLPVVLDYGRARNSEDEHDSELQVWNRNCSPVSRIRTITVAPTRTANLWLAKNTIFTEAGAQLLGDRSRWIKLIRRLRPGQFEIGGRRQRAGATRGRCVCECGDVHAAGSRRTTLRLLPRPPRSG